MADFIQDLGCGVAAPACPLRVMDASIRSGGYCSQPMLSILVCSSSGVATNPHYTEL
jgi:hypothetical protein